MFHASAVAEGVRALLALLKIHRDRHGQVAHGTSWRDNSSGQSRGAVLKRLLLQHEDAPTTSDENTLLSVLALGVRKSADAVERSEPIAGQDFCPWRSSELFSDSHVGGGFGNGEAANDTMAGPDDDEAGSETLPILLRCDVFATLASVLMHQDRETGSLEASSGEHAEGGALWMDDDILDCTLWMVSRMRQRPGMCWKFSFVVPSAHVYM